MVVMRCAVCEQCFLVIGPLESDATCECGGELGRQDLLPGRYRVELSAPEVISEDAVPIEKDQGYGESHGNPLGHSGPSGPGDAPGPAD